MQCMVRGLLVLYPDTWICPHLLHTSQASTAGHQACQKHKIKDKRKMTTHLPNGTMQWILVGYVHQRKMTTPIPGGF